MEIGLIVAAFVGGLIGGPALVVRLWPHRSSVTGSVKAGSSGVSPIFWGQTLGVGFGYLAIAACILLGPPSTPPTPLVDQVELILVLFALLSVCVSPLSLCGFHRWSWDAGGFEFIGVFRRQKLLWNEIDDVRAPPTREGLTLISKARRRVYVSPYMSGQRLVIGALMHYRQDLTASIEAAFAQTN